ncbi:uncharacterized protein G2W53_032731 [Senna tora]|uniref:Uncharacterized protein n=1 Tax=Senna tora TaxID=362788 RepID=A0A834SZF8_9FABA|nr:uncharacterized protein G2W53_032731 [Senna tora]
MASSSIRESRGIPVVGIRNTYFGDREPGNQETNNSEQAPIDNVDLAMFEARIPKAALNVHKQLRLSCGGTFHSFKPDVKPIHGSVYCFHTAVYTLHGGINSSQEAQRRIHLLLHPTLSLLLWLSEHLWPFLFEYAPSFEPLSSVLHTNGLDKNEVGKVKGILSVDAVHDKLLRRTSI